jgi:hypothetical protein
MTVFLTTSQMQLTTMWGIWPQRCAISKTGFSAISATAKISIILSGTPTPNSKSLRPSQNSTQQKSRYFPQPKYFLAYGNLNFRGRPFPDFQIQIFFSCKKPTFRMTASVWSSRWRAHFWPTWRATARASPLS